jgi:hypothetical protein
MMETAVAGDAKSKDLTPATLLAGLFLTTLATLMLEVLDTRLLSVITWYHLSFLAVSVAMLGMAAGAVLVFVGGRVFSHDNAARALPATALLFAIALPVSHIGNLMTPFLTIYSGGPAELASVAFSTIILTVPFVISGVVVTLALTRTRGRIGRLYAADLAGAAAGCLAIIWLLERTDITSTAFAAGACAAAGAWCFARAGRQRGVAALLCTAALGYAVVANVRSEAPLGVIYPKSREQWLAKREAIDFTAWNAHSYVVVGKSSPHPPFLWGPGADLPPDLRTTLAWAVIDGEAGTTVTAWDGDPASLQWTTYDVTALPYRLRHGRVGVIGVGGGRDLLTAIGAGNASVTGIEINKALLGLLQGRYRSFTRIADHPGVQLVHDEARSYLSRTADRFDVLQMSLIDTWAATGAGAFTLTENGLYTREGWRVFLDALTPTGVFSVSRWFHMETGSESTRLLALGVASLIDRGIAAPRQHLLLVTREHVATLLVSLSPFTADDAAEVRRVAGAHGFTIRIAPWDTPAENDPLSQIADATTMATLGAAVRDPDFDYSPPSDARPFFFNMLKPWAVIAGRAAARGVSSGNLLATKTLITLAVVATAMVGAIVLWPLLAMGRPDLSPPVFRAALAYFAAIGLGFMFFQIAMLQRLSVYLGHPTYTFSIILFLMILAAGAGSVLSERLDPARSRLVFRLPLAIAAMMLIELALLQPIVDATIAWPLSGRSAVVAALLVPVAIGLGCCFPIGIRLLGRHSDRVTAWMWGVNGACGVLASIVAVMVSMWIGIWANLIIAAALYAAVSVMMRKLAR